MTRPDWITLFLDTPLPRWRAGVEFWSAVTGCEASVSRGEHGQFVTLLPRHGHPSMKLQAVDEPSPRLHLDLDTTDRTVAIAESRRFGARDAWMYGDVAVMRSPGGLLFCHTLGGVARRPRMDRTQPHCVVDQVCLDIPPRLWDAEVSFWQTLTGRVLERSGRPEFALLADPDPAGPPRILLQRLEDDAPAVEAHLDLAAADREAEARRHESLGAQRIEDFEPWTQMRAPSGHVYCLTDREPSTGQ